MKKIITIIGGFMGGMLVLAFAVFLAQPFNVGAVTANSSGEPVDLIGSISGTTTTGVHFLDTAGTTTYPFSIGSRTDNVTITFKPVTASSSANASFNILASNDPSCDTATTSTIYNVPLATHINWADGSSYLKDLAGTRDLVAATTTFNWPITGTGQTKNIVLTNVNSKCLAVAIHASSTSIFAQFMTK